MHLLQYSPLTQNENWKRGGKGSFLLAKNNILIKKKKEYRQVRPEDDLWLFRPIIFLTKENIKLLHLFRHRYPKKSGGKTMNLFPILVMVMIKMVELLQEILEISISLSIRSLAQKSWRLVKASWFAARYPAETGYISLGESTLPQVLLRFLILMLPIRFHLAVGLLALGGKRMGAQFISSSMRVGGRIKLA